MGVQKKAPKNEDKIKKIVELTCVLFKKHLFQIKWLRVCKIKYINEILLVLRKGYETPAENVPKIFLDATL